MLIQEYLETAVLGIHIKKSSSGNILPSHALTPSSLKPSYRHPVKPTPSLAEPDASPNATMFLTSEITFQNTQPIFQPSVPPFTLRDC